MKNMTVSCEALFEMNTLDTVMFNTVKFNVKTKHFGSAAFSTAEKFSFYIELYSVAHYSIQCVQENNMT